MNSSKDTIVHQDNSTLSWCLKKWWTWSASFLPANLAPNVITFIGGFFMLCSAILAIFSRGPWTLLFHALAIFLFQTFDAWDGIQARKTLASKLGNYIDHSVDIFSLQIMFQVLFQTLELKDPLYTVASIFVSIAIYCTHWETSVTGVLYFTDGFSITEIQVLCMVTHLLTYHCPGIWLLQCYGLELGNIFTGTILSLNLIFLVIPQIIRVIEHRSGTLETKVFDLLGVIMMGMLFGYWCLVADIGQHHSSGLIKGIILCIPFINTTLELLLSYLFPSKRYPAYNLNFIIFLDLVYPTIIMKWVMAVIFLVSLTWTYIQSVYLVSKDLKIPIFSLPLKKD